MRTFIALFLVFSILALSGNMFAKERKGADLIIYKNDGQQLRGELIAVKKNSLLLMERESGADVTVDNRDIRAVKIVKKSETTKNALFGFLMGVVSGAVFGVYGVKVWEIDRISKNPDFEATTKDYIQGGLIGGAVIGVLEASLAALASSIAGMDENIQIEGKSDSEIQEILEKLRKKARIHNSQ